MNERRSHADRHLADLDLAYSLFGETDSVEGRPVGSLSDVALHAKRVEIKLAAARLADAEFRLAALLARRDFLEARSAQGNATDKDFEALKWTIEALPSCRSAMTELTAVFEVLKRDLKTLLTQTRPDADRRD